MMGQITGVLTLLNQETVRPHWVQILYFIIGLIIFGIVVNASRVQAGNGLRDNRRNPLSELLLN